MAEILNIFSGIKGTLRLNYHLAPITWFGVGGRADIFFKPLDLDDLRNFLIKNANTENFPVIALGACSNVLIRDNGINGITVRMGQGFSYTKKMGNLIKVGAATLNKSLANFCLNNSIGGFEFLLGIPGTVGGGVFMNAGSYGTEFKDILDSVEVIDLSGNISIINAKDIKFQYRSSNLNNVIITAAYFKIETISNENTIKVKMNEISTQRIKTQPIKEKTCGSTFANPPGYKSWQLIDMVGMRGASFGGAKISELHSNFIINTGNATAHDIESLGNLVVQRVYDRNGITLRWEIKKIGIPK